MEVAVAKLTGMRFALVDPDSRSVHAGPRCQAETVSHTRYWRKRLNRSTKCNFKAAYEIDGVPHCRLHAGAELLKRAVDETGLEDLLK
jgi:hypothetical protein